jgi:phosphatidylinositol alpha-mannosyltransferase
VLGNPINYRFFNAFAGGNTKDSTQKTKIVYVGRFDVRKGVLQLIKAYEQMTERKNCELVMCGKGPLLEEAKAYAADNNLVIEFPGFVSEKEKATQLASADIAVFPSISGESFGIVLTEAMASGAQITLGGDNPGYASVLNPWPEVLFDPKDITAFATKLDYFVKNTTKREEIGTAQQAYVKEFDVEAIAQKLIMQAYTKK